PQVAIAGYTNAGKSSLLNRLTGSDVLVENALFATLDPTVRKARTPSGRDFTLADTVGFVRHLPHQLVEAFRSTLEEVSQADVILHVVDGSDEAPEEQIDAVRTVLADIDASRIPEIIVINKADVADPLAISRLRRREPNSIVVSAHTGEGFEELMHKIDETMPGPNIRLDVEIPYGRGDLLSRVLQHGTVENQEYLDEGTALTVRVDAELAYELQPFVTK
ncbi:MAG: hypothetical protein RIS43_213, partial [Actinomycetota bacterium]